MASPFRSPLPGCWPVGQGVHRAPQRAGSVPLPTLGHCSCRRRGFIRKAHSSLESLKSNLNSNSYRFPTVCHCVFSGKHAHLRTGIYHQPRTRCNLHARAFTAIAGAVGSRWQHEGTGGHVLLCPLSSMQLAKHPVNRENTGSPTHHLLQSFTQKTSHLIEGKCSQDPGQGALYLGLPTPLAHSLRRAELLCQLQENQ